MTGHELTESKSAFRSFLRAVGMIELLIACTATTFIVLLAIYQVGLRYLFGGSIWWAQEIAQLAALVAYFFGISFVYKAYADIAVEFIVAGLKPLYRIALFGLAQIMVIAFLLCIVYYTIQLAPSQLKFHTFILGIPKFYSSLPILIASISMIITCTYFFVLTVKRLQDLDDVTYEDFFESTRLFHVEVS